MCKKCVNLQKKLIVNDEKSKRKLFEQRKTLARKQEEIDKLLEKLKKK